LKSKSDSTQGGLPLKSAVRNAQTPAVLPSRRLPASHAPSESRLRLRVRDFNRRLSIHIERLRVLDVNVTPPDGLAGARTDD
jgi:hypothetical protein